MPHRSVVSAAFAAAVVLAPATAQAKPVTVNLRVEGPTKTVFEGRVTTDARTFRFTNETATHRCDGTGATGGSSTTPVPVRNTALVTAAEKSGLALTGSWSSFGPTFDHVGDEAVGYDAATNRYLVEYKNGEPSMVGGCSDPVADNDDVLYAYGDGTEPLLQITAPATAKPGRSAVVRVTTTKGAPVSGASVAGTTTGPDGSAIISVGSARGTRTLKATKPGTIRSARATICVTDGHDGVTCPAVDAKAPTGRISSIRDGARFARGRGPRNLRGTARDASGIRDVRLRLTRTVGKRCQTYDARSERLVRARCGASHGRWFSVGAARNWRYLLPARLGRGRWVLDLRVADRAGNVTSTPRRGSTRVVFRVG